MAENSSGDRTDVFSAIKWVCIAVVALAFTFVAYKAYRIVAAPAEAVGSAAEGVKDAVKSGTEAVRESSSAVSNRLDIPALNQSKLDRTAEAAFAVLAAAPSTKAEGVKEGLLRMRHLGGHNDQVCKIDHDFGNGAIAVYVAADNDSYITSKSLGDKSGRLIRMVLSTEKDDVVLNAGWDSQLGQWQMKWKATTVKKEISDLSAAARIMDVLEAVRSECANLN